MGFALIVLALGFASPPALPGHIRPRGPELTTAATDAYRRSPEFRRLVTRIAAVHGVVYIEPRPYVDATSRRVLDGAMLHGVTIAGSQRIVRVLVRPCDRSAVIMAHELQHVLEVLEAGATTQSEVEALYARIGAQTGAGVSETAAATETERLVERDLRKR